MIEILILYILYKDKNTLYGIRKTIKNKFLHLNSATFGSIHPAMNRLIEKNLAKEEKTISSGGRKKNIYSITKNGQANLIMTLNADISLNINNLEKQISTKLACCDILNEPTKKNLYIKAIRYYEYRIAVFSKLLKNNDDYTELQAGQLKNFILNYQNEIEMLKNLAEIK